MARLVLYRGKWYAAVQTPDGIRRTSLRTSDRATAERRLADATKRPDTAEIAEAVAAHLVRCEGKASLPAMKYAWAALKPTFGALRIDQITPERCLTYRRTRKRQGVSDGTVIKELAFLRSAVKRTANGASARFEMPASPPPTERWITEDEAEALMGELTDPHLRLFTILALTTAARSGAILDLTWDRVDMTRRQIALGKAQEGRKRRAVVPVNDTAFAALQAAQSVSTCEFVVEYAGRQIKSIKKGFREAAKRAGLDDVTPHVLRHTAATWMVQKGIPIEQVAKYLGHSDPRITYRVYAKHAPDYLKAAAAAVEFKGGVFRTPERNSVNTGRTNGTRKASKMKAKDGKSNG